MAIGTRSPDDPFPEDVFSPEESTPPQGAPASADPAADAKADAPADASRAGTAGVDLSGFDEIRAVLRLRAFRRLWLVLGLSALGDWLGLLATSVFAAAQVSGSTAKGLAFGGVIAVRLLPALVLGPVAGVLADRFDRRYTMVVCDVLRFGLSASIPLVGLLAGGATTVAWAAIATFAIETAAMVWTPAKEAAVPNLLPRPRLEKANQITLATTYALTPVLAAALAAALNWVLGHLGVNHAADVALLFNAATFLAIALTVFFGIPEISGRDDQRERGEQPSSFQLFLEGYRFVGSTPLVRGLVFGILGAFAGGGVVIGTAKFYALSLGGGDGAFYLLFGVIFVGLGIGIAAGPRLIGQLSRRRWFGLSIVLAGMSVLLLALAPHLTVAVLGTLLVGAGAGMAFLSGITLLGGEIPDDMRGRVFAFVQTAVRVVLMLAISLSGVLVGAGSSHVVELGGLEISVSATRILLIAAGVVGVATGVTALRQMDDKPGVPLLADLWSSVRGRPIGLAEPPAGRGLFVVFEGGEGAGKSTQAIKLAAWVGLRGFEAVITREPGATDVGARIRGLLLDRPASTVVSPRAEALLYAADRAHHVATVIRPALARGAVVVCDRYVDSSLAYQGAGRTLPAEEVGWLSNWATGGLKPDLVILLDLDPVIGLERVDRRGNADALERESPAFHERVRYAFLDLAAADRPRYLVVDALADPETIAEQVRARVSELLPEAAPGTANGASPSTGFPSSAFMADGSSAAAADDTSRASTEAATESAAALVGRSASTHPGAEEVPAPAARDDR